MIWPEVRLRPFVGALPARPARDAIHVIEVKLPAGDRSSQRLAALLSRSEAARAARFIAPARRRQFAVGRVMLRHALAPGHRRPAANLAHAGSWVLLAVSGRRRIGVDVEQPFPPSQIDLVGRKVLSPAERATVKAAGPEAPRCLQRLWVAKEAVLKADRRGFGLDPRTVDIDLDQRLGHTPDGEYTIVEWWLDRQSCAAVAVPGSLRAPRLVRYRYRLATVLAEIVRATRKREQRR